MTPAELRAILSRLGLQQVRAADLLGVDSRTVRRWMTGDIPVPVLVACVLRMADAGKLSLEKLANYGTKTEPEL